MSQMLIRNLDADLVAKLKFRAKSNNRSAEAEVREILKRALVAYPGEIVTMTSLIGAARTGRSQAEIDAYVVSLRDESGN